MNTFAFLVMAYLYLISHYFDSMKPKTASQEVNLLMDERLRAGVRLSALFALAATTGIIFK